MWLVVLAAEIAFAGLLGVVVPVLALSSRRMLDAGRLPRGRRLFVTLAAQVIALGVLALLLAILRGRPLLEDAAVPGPWPVVAAVLVLAAICALMPWRWRRLSPIDRRRLGGLLPRGREEAPAWIAVSCAAGWGEELAYRGVLTAILAGWTGSPLAGALLSAAAFAAAHAVQGRSPMVVVFVLALGFQALCWATGSLWPAMILHAAYDVAAGFTYGALARREEARVADVARAASPPH